MAFMAKIEAQLRKKEQEKAEAERIKELEKAAEEATVLIDAEEAKRQEELEKQKAEELEKQRVDEEIEKKIKKAKKSLAERKTSYVSKLEELAEAKTVVKVKEKPKKKEKKEEVEERKFRASELKKDKDLDYTIKPVYSEEELAELEHSHADDKWNDYDVDFDEFDKYYDED